MNTNLETLEGLIKDIKQGQTFDPAPLQAQIDALKTQQQTDEADIATVNQALTDALKKLDGDTPDVPGAIAALQAVSPISDDTATS